MRVQKNLFLFAVAALLMAGCGKETSFPQYRGSSENLGTMEAVAPNGAALSAVPSYSRDLMPIIQSKCMPCHNGSMATSGAPNWLVYANAHAKAASIKNRVFVLKNMPLGGTLTPDQRQLFASWADGGAPQ